MHVVKKVKMSNFRFVKTGITFSYISYHIYYTRILHENSAFYVNRTYTWIVNYRLINKSG